MFIPSRVLGKDGAIAPSNQITLGVIGYGNRCKVVLDHFLTFKQIRCTDVSDVQAKRLADAKARVDKQYTNNDCRTHADFRELLAKDDVQAVLIATGNRWHGMASIMAARAGKDVYSEKPICMTIEEGRALVETCRRLGTIYQAGHQRRSVDSFRFMVDVVRRGMIGQLKEIIAQVWQGPSFKPAPKAPVPPGLDWDMWLGPTPWHEFTPPRFYNWQYFWDTAEGMLTDMGCHWADIAQWGHNSDDTGPTEIEGEAVWDKAAMSETPITGEIRSTYADGVKLIMRQKGAFKERYIRFVGSEGWIQLDDETNIITAQPASLLKLRSAGGKGWDDTGDHIGDFLESIRTRQPTVCNPEVAFRAQAICLIGTICLRLGRKLKWDPKGEKFVGDDEANRMLGRAVRGPWRL
jgi:predicted dehydrogenase